MNHLLAAFKDTFTQFWDERQERERQYIIAAAVAAILLLVYLVGIDPALTGREELSKSLPTMHQQMAKMQRMAQELAALPSKENLHEVSRELVESSLSKNAIKAKSVSEVEGVVRVQIDSTSMAALQTWLLEMQKTFGLYVDEMKITGLEGGLVSANLTLRPSTSGG